MALKVRESLLVCGHEDGIVRVWDWNSGQLIHVLDTDLKQYVYILEFNVDGSLLATGQSNGVIKIWNVNSG
jgi:WD40 repeat protein